MALQYFKRIVYCKRVEKKPKERCVKIVGCAKEVVLGTLIYAEVKHASFSRKVYSILFTAKKPRSLYGLPRTYGPLIELCTFQFISDHV